MDSSTGKPQSPNWTLTILGTLFGLVLCAPLTMPQSAWALAIPTPTPKRASSVLYGGAYRSVEIFSLSAAFGTQADQLTLTSVIGDDVPSAVAVDARGRIYALNSNTGTIAVYAPGSAGDVQPIARISGGRTGLSGGKIVPKSIAVDAFGRIYVPGKDGVLVFSAGSAGNVMPAATIAGALTGLCVPIGVALDRSGNIYVANLFVGCGGDSPATVNVYPAFSSGDVAPKAVITGGISSPRSLAVDAAGNIYLVDSGDEVRVFAAGSDASTAAVASIFPATTQGPEDLEGIAVDGAGNILVSSSDSEGGSVLFFPPGSNGTVAPSTSLRGSNTGIADPAGIALDGSGNLYVANLFGGPGSSGGVTTYTPGSTGDASPSAAITGTDTGIFEPAGVAFDRAGNIYVASSVAFVDGYRAPGGVSVFTGGSRGAASPYARISGPSTLLSMPEDIAIDGAGNIYVLDLIPYSSGTKQPTRFFLRIYAAGSNGDIAPVRSLDVGGEVSGSGEGALAVDAAGTIYVANNAYPGSVAAYAPGSDGTASPARIIQGSRTRIAHPQAIALDASDNIYLLNQAPGGGSSILVFDPGSDGNVAPAAVILGPSTLLRLPELLSLDASANIYVAGGKTGVNVYAPRSNGDVSPRHATANGVTFDSGFLRLFPPATP